MNYDIIIIGGGPAGIVAAQTAKKYYPNKTILMLKEIGDGVIPCGIPYMFQTLKEPEKNALNTDGLKNLDINIIVDSCTKIDKEKKYVLTKKTGIINYQKLILATGSVPFIPKIEGSDLLGVYPIIKKMDHLKNLKEDIKKATNVVILGAGFIGIEFADELAALDCHVTLIEMAPRVLANSFDGEYSQPAQDILEKKGITVLTGKKVVSFEGDRRVRQVRLEDGAVLPAQIVILGIGALPNIELGKEAGLEINKAITVDEYLKTSDEDIFAIGDCAEKKDFFTRKKINCMLASTATAEARVAGANLFELKIIKTNKGTIANYSTKIGDTSFASAGLTENTAIKEGFDIVIGNSEAPDKHPGCLEGAKHIKIKLIFSKYSGILLGGQIIGGDSIGELINVIAFAIQKNATILELETLQIATHPKLTSAPTIYPLISAAQDALSKSDICQ